MPSWSRPCFADRDLMRRSEPLRAARARPSRRPPRRPARSTGSRCACGSSARTRPEARDAVRDARQVEAARQPRPVRDRHPRRCSRRSRGRSRSPRRRLAGALCLIALVSSSLTSARSGSPRPRAASSSAAPAPSTLQWIVPAEGPLHRAGDRLEHADASRSGPVVADLQAVDLGDRLHLADDLVDRRRRPRASARRSAAAGRRRPAGCS